MTSLDPEKLKTDFRFLALHRYWIWANRLREYFDKALVDSSWVELAKQHGSTNLSVSMAFFCHDPGIFMSHWYGALCVVIEGWKDLHLDDPAIDGLLQHQNVELLRRYRNGAFHFQQDYFDARFHEFMSEQGTVEWVRTLNKELGRFFLMHLNGKDEVKA